MKHDFMEGLKLCIDQILTHPSGFSSDDDKLLAALLFEISERLYGKLGKFQSEYKVSFSPAQALALHLLYIDYVNNPTSYLGNNLFKISLEVSSKYS